MMFRARKTGLNSNPPPSSFPTYRSKAVLRLQIVVRLWFPSRKYVHMFYPLKLHCILNRLSHIIYWKSPISILGRSGYEIFTYSWREMAKLIANNGDPDQTPRSAASDLGLYCLLITLLRVSRLQWVKPHFYTVKLGFKGV